MDNQQHQGLEKLYNYLSGQPVSNFEEISSYLDISYNEILPLLNELQLMGLDILVDNNQIRLLSQVDVINVNDIKIKTRSLKLNKPIIFQFISQSTNLLAKNNNQDSIYICDYQNNGKGRQAKKWITPLGQSIALSISHRFNFGLGKLAGLNIAIGVAIIQTLYYCGGKNIGLKWPNDILGPEGKVAGILIEASGNTQACRAIIGIGLNWNIHKELFNNIDQPCDNAGIHGIKRTQFITELIINIENIIEDFTNNALKNIHVIWQKYDLYTNKPINIIYSDTMKAALYKGINNKGLLNVEIDKKPRTLASGEVSIRLLP